MDVYTKQKEEEKERAKKGFCKSPAVLCLSHFALISLYMSLAGRMTASWFMISYLILSI